MIPIKIPVVQNTILVRAVLSCCAAVAIKETTSQAKAMANGVHRVEKSLELTALSAFHAIVMAPVMAAKLVSD